ncbi:PIN domain-containing protein [Halapricum sp. CBA1109]|uniref:type II toxin-antitoxin system VapC family toxin n=1 Tax=Halapricum sp. CBA1109 TaxID=2668068 RepID=UPI0012FC4A85|nr:PIN domain-containing protein [Halapricum sp. CBA1109]MUV90129.1 PIN domain-containing protein [Halapricum sp. CBA1109]
MKLLDTTFLIRYWAGEDDVRAYLEGHEEAEFATTTLNLKEIAVGRELQGKLDREEILATFEWVRIVPFSIDHAIAAGELEAALHRDESVNQDNINALTGDLLIAAVARERGATVVTENVEDFESFDGVAVETYRSDQRFRGGASGLKERPKRSKGSE